MAHPLVLYDGVCGLCNLSVLFVLRRDQDAIFRFSSLQSSLAKSILSRYQVNPTDVDTGLVVLNFNPDTNDLGAAAEAEESILSRSDAVVYVLRRLPGFWRALGIALGFVPRFLRDWGYGIVARHRYRLFGRFETCPLPDPAIRSRFLGL